MKAAVEERVGKKYEIYTAKTYQYQIVAGINYFIKVSYFCVCVSVYMQTSYACRCVGVCVCLRGEIVKGFHRNTMAS